MARTWIFGYGSLIFRPAFRALAAEPGFIRGYVRRFWQASTDHRGTPEAPGRVVTLVPRAGETCWGMAFEVEADERSAILEQLDEREKGGYRRIDIDVELSSGRTVGALAYYADASNENYVGEASLESIAAIARVARGPSGANADYISSLADALRQMGADDPHVFALAERVGA